MPTFIEANTPTLSTAILEYAPTAPQNEVVQAPVSFQTQTVAESVEDTAAKEAAAREQAAKEAAAKEAEEAAVAKAKKAEWLRMYFLGYI